MKEFSVSISKLTVYVMFNINERSSINLYIKTIITVPSVKKRIKAV